MARSSRGKNSLTVLAPRGVSPPVRIGLVGGGKGGSALLELLLDWPTAKVAVVVDPRPDAPALGKAWAIGIPTATHHLQVFSYPVDLVLEVTGQAAVLDDLLGAKPPGVEVMGAGGLRFFWGLLTHQAAMTLENVRLLEETDRRAQEQAILNAIATAMSQRRHLDDLFRIALDKVLKVTGREHGYIRLKDPVTGEITLAAYRGVSQEHLEVLLHQRTPGGKSDQVFASGQPLVVNDPERALLKGEVRREGFQAIAWIPLKARGRVLGILNVATSRPLPFAPREVGLLQAIGNVIGVAVENARLYEEVRGARDFLRSVAENSVDAIVTTDPHGRITYFSPGAEELFSFQAEATLGQRAVAYYRGGLKEARAIMRRLGAEGRIRNYETAIRTEDGRWVEVSSSLSLLRDANGAAVGTMAVLRDITERQRAEEQLRQAEFQYRQLVESVQAIVWQADAQTFQFSFVSKQAEAILGFPVDRWLTEPTFWKDHLHPEDRDWAVAFCVNATKEKKPHEFDYRMIAADGRVVWLRDFVQVVVENDCPKELIGVMVDITARKRAEEAATALAEVGRELAGTLDLSQATDRVVSTVCRLFGVRRSTLFLLDPASGTLTCVATAGPGESEKWLGRTLPAGAGIAGRAVREGRAIWSPDVLTDPRIELPEWMVTAIKEGGHRSAVGVPLTASGEVLGALILGDIADRIFTDDDLRLLSVFAAQAALAVSNARLYQRAEKRAQKLTALSTVTRLITGAPDSRAVFYAIANAATSLLAAKMARVWVAESGGRTLRAQASVGVEPELDQVVTDFSIIPYGKGLVGTAVESRAPLYVRDVQEDPRALNQRLARAADLHAFAGLPLVTGDRVVGVLAIFFGDRREFTPEEIELMNLLADQAVITIEQARLFEELKRSYEEIQRAQEQLVRSETLRALGEMAAGVAHDFNNLLAVILGRAEILQTRVKEPDFARGLEIIRKAALDGAQTVRRIQEFTRTRRTRPFQRVDLREVLQEVVELTRPRWKDEAQSRGVSYEVCIKGGAVPLVAGRPEELREVLTNLLINALEAMPAGGWFVFHLSADPKEVVVRAEDSGCGMSEETCRRVFEPFFTTKGPRGTGLGLAAAWGIVARHGGSIAVESQVGAGSTFTVRLPVPLELPPEEKPESAPQPPRTARILVIEDEEEVCAVLRDILTAAGYTVLEAVDGTEGLARCETESVDLLLTDLSMPGMSGWQVAEACRAHFPQLPVGFITGWGDQLDSTRLDRLGIRFVVAKPFETSDILRHVAQALRETQDT